MMEIVQSHPESTHPDPENLEKKMLQKWAHIFNTGQLPSRGVKVSGWKISEMGENGIRGLSEGLRVKL